MRAIALLLAAALPLCACEPYPYDEPPPPGYYGPGGYGPGYNSPGYNRPGYNGPGYGPGYNGPGYNGAGYNGAGNYGPGYYGGNDDPCFTNVDYCNYGYFDGPISWSGAWYNGPHRFRDRDGRREFWIHGNWHDDVTFGSGGRWYGPRNWQPD